MKEPWTYYTTQSNTFGDNKVVLLPKNDKSFYVGQQLWIPTEYWQSIGCPASIDDFYAAVEYNNTTLSQFLSMSESEKIVEDIKNIGEEVDDKEFRKKVKEAIEEGKKRWDSLRQFRYPSPIGGIRRY